MELHSPPQKKGRKNIKFSARKVARPVHGVRMRELLDSKGRRKLFFFFFFEMSPLQNVKYKRSSRGGRHNRHNDPNFYANRSYAPLFFFLSLSIYTHRVNRSFVILVVKREMEEIFRKVDQATESGNLMTIMIVIKRSKISKNKTCN